MANNFLGQNPPLKPPFEIIERETKTINVKYKECKRNHAPQLGVLVYDGCGEFAPKERSSETLDLDCHACGCHRNFHRKEVTKKIALTFIENEEANLFRFQPQLPQLNDDQNQEESEETTE